MAVSKDFNDVLDDIVLGEEKESKSSYDEGFRAGIEAGNIEGYHLGYHRGAELGRELGFYWSTVNEYLELNKTSDAKLSEKIIAQLLKVKELIDNFPPNNSEDHDILGMADAVRAQYKKACALLKIPSNNPYDAGVSF